MPMNPNNTIAVTTPTKATAPVPPLLRWWESFADGGGGANAKVCDGVEWESKGLVLEGGGGALLLTGAADAAGEGEELWGGGGGEETDAGGKLNDCGDSDRDSGGGAGGEEAGGKDWDGNGGSNGENNGDSEVELGSVGEDNCGGGAVVNDTGDGDGDGDNGNGVDIVGK